MPAEQESTDAGGLSRRQLVTRGAIAGGLVWAAPIIRTTAAYATTANGTEKPCQNFFMVVINPAGHALPAPARIQYHTTPPAIRRWFRDNPGVTVQFPSVKPQLTAVSDEEAAVLLPEVTGPNAAGRQCRMVLGFARKGDKDFSEAFIDPDPPIAVAVGRRIIFPCPRASEDGVISSGVDSSSVASDTTTTTTADTAADPTTPDPTTPDPTTADPTAADPSTADPSAADPSAADPSAADPSATDPSATDDSGTSSVAASSALSATGNGNSGGNGSDDHGNGHCFDSLYLIYCCPR